MLPFHCISCGLAADQNYDLCKDCENRLPWISDRCKQCGLELDYNAERLRCSRCGEKPPPFDELYALFEYVKPLTSWIPSFKSAHKLYYGKVLGTLLQKALSIWYHKRPFPELIVPMPLHPKRLQTRSFNQVYEFLKPAMASYNLPINPAIASRIRWTVPQASLDKEARLRNLAHAFLVQPLKNVQHIAIVDDVVTTASTVSALSLLFKEQGVEWIDIWTICRA